MIQRYDEVIAEKASKTQVIEIEKKAYEKYAKKDLMNEQLEDHEERIVRTHANLRDLTKRVDFMTREMTKNIEAAVGRCGKKLEGYFARKPVR